MPGSILPKQTGATFASAMLNAPQMRHDSGAFIDPGHGQRTSRKNDNGLYDPNKPVLLHEDIVDGDVAAAGVLMEFGFVLCDADADTWFHPYSRFHCRSQTEEYCRWKRNTIFRCSVTTNITRQDHTLRWVTDLEPLGSLHHPSCINDDCRLNLKPGHIMHLEKRQLVSRILSDPEKDALLSRKRDKWFGQFQDEYPMPVGVMPFSRNASEGPMKKRKLRQSPKAKNPTATYSHTPDAGPSRPRSDPITEHLGNEPHGGQFYDAGDARHSCDINPSLEPEHLLPRPASPSLPGEPRAADEEVRNDLGGYPGITRLTDHYLISAQECDRMQADKTALQTRVAKLEQEVDPEERAALRKENAELKSQRDRYKEQAEKATKQVEALKSKALQLFG